MATFGSVDVAVKFIADASSVRKEVDKLDTSGSKAKTWAKGIGLAIGGAFSVKAVGDFVSAAEEANSVQAKLTQALANAGDASGQYAKHAADLANTLQYKTGIDDEVIKGGQTILATFHDVSDAAGQQSGVFDRATKAALDMSKAGFGSVESASTMLGKALQDPAKGLTALGRAGVTFSAKQKAAIKAMVDSGDKAGAMKAILKEVENQVGGVAEASATQGDKMKVAWGETQESIGQAILPLAEKLAPIVASIAQWVQQNSTLVLGLGLAAAAIWLVNIALAANPFTLIAIAVVGLVAAIFLLWQNWDTVWGWITDLIGVAVGWIVEQWQKLIDFIQPVIDAVMLIWNTAFKPVFKWIMDLIGKAVAFIKDHWKQIILAVAPVIGIILLLWNNWDKIWGWIKKAVATAVQWIKDHWRQIVLAVAPVIAILMYLWNNWRDIWNKIKDFVGSAARWIGDKLSAIWGFFHDLPGKIASAVSNIGEIIKKPFQWAWDQIIKIKDGIARTFGDAISGVKNVWNTFARGWNAVQVDVPKVHIPWPVDKDIGGFTFGLPDLPQFAKGGLVTRPTLAVLGEAGPEMVVPLTGPNARPVGPAVVIQNATFSTEADIDLFMRRAAWQLQTQRV